MNAQQTRTVRRARAGQPVSEGTTSARTINASLTGDPLALHRVDTQNITDSHAHFVTGNYEVRPMPIDVAKPDAYDLRGKDYDDAEDAGIDWVIGGVLVCFVAVLAFGAYIIF